MIYKILKLHHTYEVQSNQDLKIPSYDENAKSQNPSKLQVNVKWPNNFRK